MATVKKSKKAYFDARGLIRDMGGRSRLPGALREHRIADDVNEQQVDKWIARNSISSRHLGALLLLAHIERRPIDIYLYVRDTRK